MLEESQKELQEKNADVMYRLSRIEERIKGEEHRFGVLLREYAAAQNTTTLEPIFRQAKEDTERLLTELMEERDKLTAQLQYANIDDAFIDDL